MIDETLCWWLIIEFPTLALCLSSRGLAEIYRILALVISFYFLWNVLITFSSVCHCFSSPSASFSTLVLPLILPISHCLFFYYVLLSWLLFSMAPGDDWPDVSIHIQLVKTVFFFPSVNRTVTLYQVVSWDIFIAAHYQKWFSCEKCFLFFNFL